jgi:uncharacterized cupin superfamily protein
MLDLIQFQQAPGGLRLEPAPFPKAWVRQGNPIARAVRLWGSADNIASTMVWECSAGLFEWHYGEEETVMVLEGEVFVTPEGGREFRLGPGDTAVFRFGSKAVWRIPERVRKVAICRHEAPLLPSIFIRGWRKIMRTLGRLTGGGAPHGGLAAQ